MIGLHVIFIHNNIRNKYDKLWQHVKERMIGAAHLQETFRLQVCYQLCFTNFFFFFYKAIISLIMCMLHQYFKVRRPYSYHPPIVSFWHDVQLDSYQNKGSSECENWTKQQDLSLIYLVSTSRTSAASWSLRCPFSPWPPPPGSSEMVRRSFLECLLGWYLWDHLWRQK